MTGLRTELQNTETPAGKPDKPRPINLSIRPPTHNRVEQDFSDGTFARGLGREKHQSKHCRD
jgi:hypothetical protein